MKRFFAVAAAIWIATAALDLSAEGARRLQWSDLGPPQEPFIDPFDALPREQQIDLNMVAVVRELQAAKDPSLGPEQLRSYEAMLGRLKRANVDVDGMLARRARLMEKWRKASEAVNETLNGQRVRLPGYLLPLEMDGKKVTEFLLVPYVGACIHAPTPPPNQIVHVKHPKGFEAGGVFSPVWVQGVVRTVRARLRLTLVDGSADVPTGYELSAESVELHRP